jgi:hypothetical protein
MGAVPFPAGESMAHVLRLDLTSPQNSRIASGQVCRRLHDLLAARYSPPASKKSGVDVDAVSLGEGRPTLGMHEPDASRFFLRLGLEGCVDEAVSAGLSGFIEDRATALRAVGDGQVVAHRAQSMADGS